MGGLVKPGFTPLFVLDHGSIGRIPGTTGYSREAAKARELFHCAPMSRMIAAVIHLVDCVTNPKWARASLCRACEDFEEKVRQGTADYVFAPLRPGAVDPTVGCFGCVYSMVDQTKARLGQVLPPVEPHVDDVIGMSVEVSNPPALGANERRESKVINLRTVLPQSRGCCPTCGGRAKVEEFQSIRPGEEPTWKRAYRCIYSPGKPACPVKIESINAPSKVWIFSGSIRPEQIRWRAGRHEFVVGEKRELPPLPIQPVRLTPGVLLRLWIQSDFNKSALDLLLKGSVE